MDAKATALRTLIQASVAAAVFLLVMLLLNASEVFLAIFGGILLAVLFHGTATWVRQKTGLSRPVAFAVSLLAPLLLAALGLWIVAPSVSEQAAELADRLPQAVARLQEQVRQYDWADRLIGHADRVRDVLPGDSGMAGAVATFFSSTFGGLGNIVFALVVGLFLAMAPSLYVKGLLHLVPLDKRDRAREVLNATGDTLGSWLMAKLISMVVIGVLTTLGLWFIGIDLALVLGVIAALLSFIPNFGPVISLLPAALIALIIGPDQLAYVVALYIGVQVFESYLLTPFLQQRMADLPPALTISMQVLLGSLAGIIGIILATPLTAAVMVMVKMWYVEDLLGDGSVGSSKPPRQAHAIGGPRETR
ncbi:AI-2E family transporter [Massilia sp. PAMC28688]|uniref:AI-2E family transporter n=1 Tax=Massilia sp. PAMC28688 TaxID=2861283 RepID=UPI001C62BFAB|nr:AI-2E family transporter [Massilia sp. PAMC28688]QYF93267.1 AI-2E family transporter [Massilia sp. PAMC28688]